MSIKDLLTTIAVELVDVAGSVAVREIAGDAAVIYEVRVDKKDIGKIVGKNGSTIQAIRTIAHNVGMKLKKRVMVEVVG